MNARLFVALDVSDEIKVELAGLAALFRKFDFPIRWANPHDLHLTLKFLGNCDEEAIPRINESLEKIAVASEPVSLHLADTGVFPDIHRPQILWVGVDEDRDALGALARRVDSGLEPFGFSPETRPFCPHITLGRFRQSVRAEALDHAMESLAFSSVFRERIRHLSLYRSRLSPEGSVYELIYRAEFLGV